MTNYIILDFETAGIDPLTTMPVQAAWLVMAEDGKEREKDSMFINPNMEISKGAQAVHGITAEKVKEQGVSLEVFSEIWHKLIWKYQPVTLLGYNIINFDLIILQHLLGKHKDGRFKFPPILKVLDVMFLAQRSFRMKGWPKLIEAVNRLGIPHDPDAFHDALEDVRFTWKVYEKLVMKKKP